jgi:hypothetical protein
MKRRQLRLLAITVIAGLSGMVEGCSGSNPGSTGPITSPTAPGPTAPGLPTYTISGVITAYRGGPISGMNVGAYPYPYGGGTMTQTDSEGRYAVGGLSARKIGLEIWSGGYATAFKYDLEPHDQTVNFVAHPTFSASAAGSTVSGTIAGDEFITGDDDFGGRCTGTPCKVVTFDRDYASRKVEVRLRWTDATRQLALYFGRGDTYFPPAFPPPPADRYCCSSELAATYTFNADFDRFAIGFEQAAGGRPGPADAQPFELTVQPVR